MPGILSEGSDKADRGPSARFDLRFQSRHRAATIPASTSSKARSTLARPFSDGKAPSKGTISRAWSS